VKEKGDVEAEDWFNDPAPFSVKLTNVALLKVLLLIVIGVVTQVLPLILFNVTIGPFTQPHETEKLVPVVVQPDAFITVIAWLPFAIPVKATPDWKEPPSRLYWMPAPIGLVTDTDALPNPSEQSTDSAGLAGDEGCTGMTTFADSVEIQPAALVTV
jgi:hypothetical protein